MLMIGPRLAFTHEAIRKHNTIIPSISIKPKKCLESLKINCF